MTSIPNGGVEQVRATAAESSTAIPRETQRASPAPSVGVRRPSTDSHSTFAAARSAAHSAKTSTASHEHLLAAYVQFHGEAGDLLFADASHAVELLARAPALKESGRFKAEFKTAIAQATSLAQIHAIVDKTSLQTLPVELKTLVLESYLHRGAYRDGAEFYEQALGANETLRILYDIPFEKYLVCLNGSGRNLEALHQGEAYLLEHAETLESTCNKLPSDVSSAVISSMARAWKVIAQTDLASLDVAQRASTLETLEHHSNAIGVLLTDHTPAGISAAAARLSNHYYEAAFRIDFHYYPGSNLIYGAYAAGDVAQAETLIPMLQSICEEHGGLHSKEPWVLTTLLELAVMRRSVSDVEKVLRLVLNTQETSAWMLRFVATNVEQLQTLRRKAGETIDLEIPVISALRQQALSLESAEPDDIQGFSRIHTELHALNTGTKPVNDITEKFHSKSHTFREYITSASLGGNVDKGGQVGDLSISRTSVGLTRQLLHELKLDVEVDFKTWNDRVDGYLSDAFGLETFDTETLQRTRTLEDMSKLPHEVMVSSSKALLSLLVSESAHDSRTDVMAALALGVGDCRLVAYSKQLLFDVWQREQLRNAYNDAETARKRNQPKRYSACMAKAREIQRTQLVVCTLRVEAPIKMIQRYEPELDAEGRTIPTDDGKFEGVENHTLNALLIHDEGGNLVTADWKCAFYKELYDFGDFPIDLAEIDDPRGFRAGVRHQRDANGNEPPVRVRLVDYSSGRAKPGTTGGEMLVLGHPVAPPTVAMLLSTDGRSRKMMAELAVHAGRELSVAA